MKNLILINPFCQKEVQTAIARHIQNVNKKLNHWEQIQKWTLIADPLSIESGLLTPTLKLRRKAAESIYSKEIESMYSSDNQCPIQS
jgi:long-chain acyl-CoA synthetase